jgi:hypothetical protein
LDEKQGLLEGIAAQAAVGKFVYFYRNGMKKAEL